ncbi:type I-C CRISPR-associated protein Cas8c/Csd1 [Corticicoccus populi]|uniref:Type I-C CRISPR-associated protein Cas8c/Csd1 n=1 Tax=Corticicoccus populi TaxID=1812821 RepID=A0ABW5WX42_9STAP
MSLTTALLSAYEQAEKAGLVDNHNGDNTVLLPVYHNNLKSSGNNVIQVTLKKDGSFLKAEYMDKDEMIIFPVTEKSLTRSGQNPPPHPLVDKLQYVVPTGDQKNVSYSEVFNHWLDNSNHEEAIEFLKVIKKFLNNENMFTEIVEAVYRGEQYTLKDFTVAYKDDKEKEKTDDLSNVFITFIVEAFNGPINVSVTNNSDLHQDYIEYIEYRNRPNGTCYFTGKEDYIIKNHRGLMGNAKLISVSNNRETYYGRFKEGTDILQVGYRTSEKIHLMLKYLLENKNSHKWLGDQQYLVNWFSTDIPNESKVDVTNSSILSFGSEDDSEVDEGYRPVDERGGRIGDAFIKGNKKLSPDDSYYVAVIDKASNGRISIKYFRELPVSQLFTNLQKWQHDNEWWKYNYILKKTDLSTPEVYNMIVAVHGIERNDNWVLDNGQFKKLQYRKLVTSIIEGLQTPSDYVMRADLNVRNRLSYDVKWNNLMFVSMAILNKQKEGEFTKMINKNNLDRSYLYGRLLAVYERLEASTFDSSDKRLTNAEKFWTSYTNNPATMMQQLEGKVKSYEKKLKNSADKRGVFYKLDRERQEIIKNIHDNTEETHLNSALSYQFIFGYYAEMDFIFSKKEKDSEEEQVND